MKNDLYSIADLLDGYDEGNRWEILKAEKNGENEWTLTVRRIGGAENESNK